MSKNNLDRGKMEFVKKAPVFGGVSLLLVLLSLALIFTKGFNYGIDFSGGTEVQVKFDKAVQADEIRSLVKDLGLEKASVQAFGEDNEFLIRTESIQGANQAETTALVNQTVKKVTEGLKTKYAGAELRRVNSVGPQIGAELRSNGMLAIFYSLIMILIYVGFRFDYQFAPGAVICLFHDAIITLGVFSLLGKEVNVQTLAAILTIIGYSLNDTIVNFDRIRENIPLYKQKALEFVVNRSINDVLSRTVLTSITTLIAVACLYFIGTGVIKDLAFTLAIGVVVGTYSSIYVASPLTIFFDKLISSKG
ncbi:MAG: protein translocase subunit SecF [Bdellovibrionales bacterium]